jgi:hypothetical protein
MGNSESIDLLKPCSPWRQQTSNSMEKLVAQAPRATLLAVVVAMLMTGCAITPRTAPPTEVYKSKAGLDQAVDCALTRLNTTMGKGPAPNFTHSVTVITPGKVEEIIPQQIPPSRGELYVVRLTALDSGTEVTVFSTLEGLDRRVKNALDPCKESHAPKQPKKAGDSQ